MDPNEIADTDAKWVAEGYTGPIDKDYLRGQPCSLSEKVNGGQVPEHEGMDPTARESRTTIPLPSP